MSPLARSVLQRAPLLISGLTLLLTVLLVPAFRHPGYWMELSHQAFPQAALALALTPIMLTGGIDLSVGSVTVLVSVLIGCLCKKAGWPVEHALVAGMLVGLLAGVVNGCLVIVGIFPLVATLATRELFRGLALAISGDAPVSGFAAPLDDFWRTPIAGLPLPLEGLAVLFLLTWLVVHHTWMGRMIYALGDNAQAAWFAGVPVRRVQLSLYAWSGLVAGMCGAVSVLEYDTAKAGADKSLELVAIACVVLGGVRVTGGAGHVGGTLLGIITVTALLAGLSDVAARWRDTITGTLLIAVALANEAAARWVASRPVPEQVAPRAIPSAME